MTPSEAVPVAGQSAAVIGLGSMGFGMAQSLLRARLRVVGCDLAPTNLERLVACVPMYALLACAMRGDDFVVVVAQPPLTAAASRIDARRVGGEVYC